jgi:hypothetical protein
MINGFADLPDYLKKFLIDWKGVYGQEAINKYVTKKIPALKNKSIIELLNEEDGGAIVVKFINHEVGTIGGPYYLKKQK